MSLEFRLEESPPRLIVYDEKHRRLTDTNAIDELYRSGLIFEAASSQAIVLEGLTSLYLVLHSHVLAKKFYEKNGKEANLAGNITFGRAVNLLDYSGAFHLPTLADELRAYVEVRNSIAHELVGSSADIDFEAFMALGRKLMFELAPFIMEVTERATRQNAEKST